MSDSELDVDSSRLFLFFFALLLLLLLCCFGLFGDACWAPPPEATSALALRGLKLVSLMPFDWSPALSWPQPSGDSSSTKAGLYDIFLFFFPFFPSG